MATNEILQQLEHYAQIVLAPPGQVTNDDRSKAQNIFLQFQHTKSPFDLCREILETTKNDFVLFQVGGCLKNAVIREWSTLNHEKGTALFIYLFEYVNNRQTERYVVEQLMLVNSLIVKRLLISNPSNDFDKFLIDGLFDVVKNPSMATNIRLNGCSAINLIISEFNTVSSQTGSGLSWYSQLMAEQNFEKNRFSGILKGTVSVLYNHLKLSEQKQQTSDWIKLALKLTQLCECIFSWKCNSTTCFSISVILRRNSRANASTEWVDFCIDSIPFFFELYLTFRRLQDPNLIDHSLQCLVQLSSMITFHPVSFKSETLMKFCENFIRNNISLFNIISDSITIQEMVFLANEINSICNIMRHYIAQYLESEVIYLSLNIMSNLTIKAIHESTRYLNERNEDFVDKSNYVIDQLLNSWVIIQNLVVLVSELYSNNGSGSTSTNAITSTSTSTTSDSNEDCIQKFDLVAFTRPILEAYLQSRLCKPEGLIDPNVYLSDEDIHEFEEDDITKYREQLVSIGSIAQSDAQYSIDLIRKLLILKLKQLEPCICNRSTFETMHSQWICISEDIHWLLMTATYLFALNTENDISVDILTLSINCGANPEKTRQVLDAADYTVEDIDPIVKFFIVVLNLVNIEKCLLQRGMSDMISPQLSKTLGFFINRFTQVYLLPPEFVNVETSLTLETCFGADSPTAQKLIDFFLDHLLVKFMYLSSESELLIDAAKGLATFSKFKERISALQQSQSLRVLLEKFSKNELPNLAGPIRKSMYQVFIRVYSNTPELVLDPLIESYKKFVNDFKTIGDKECIREHFIQIAECTEGLANCLTEKVFSLIWDRYLKHLYEDLPNVLSLLHNYSVVVQTILELLFHFSVCFCCFLSESETISFYTVAVNILTEYARHNNFNFSTDKMRTEELQEEFIIILKLLNEISTHDIIYIFTNINISNSSSLSVIIGKMVLTCLNIIMPLISKELLENETLCTLYYKLLEYVSQDSERFRGFPIKLLDNFLESIKYVFTVSNISDDIRIIAFKIIIELGNQGTLEPEKNQEIIIFLRPFFKTIIEFIICELPKSDDYLRDVVGLALDSLIRCFPNEYKDIVVEVLHCIGQPQVEHEIANNLFQMIDYVGTDFKQKRLFKLKFAEFVHKVHNLLTL